jgi:hypothetical protein
MTTSRLQPPPFTRRDDVREVSHGVEVSDPYRWLEEARAPRHARGFPRGACARTFLDIRTEKRSVRDWLH